MTSPRVFGIDDTIAAVSTAPGRSRRGIVRLSGPDSLRIVAEASSEDLAGVRPYTSRSCSVAIGSASVPCVLYLMPAPGSYTRQDVAEIHTFGSPALTGAVLERLLDLGARPAEPGEFTKRAFLGGRIDLARAEAVLAVIRSRSAEEERAAQRALAGELSDRVSEACERLERLCVETEASIDFVEDGIETASPAGVARQLREILRSLPDPAPEDRPPPEAGIVTVIAGRPNAGKSTLFNALAGADHALVSRVSGTTRDWLSAEIEIEGITFVLVDTAGEGPAADELAEDVRRIARDQESSAQISMLVVDASEGADTAFLTRPRQGTTLVVLNKNDLAAAAGSEEIARLLPDSRIVRTSALTGEGLDELRRAMAEAVKSGLVPGGAHHTALSSRQRRMLHEARLALERGTVSCGRGLDLAASDIRDALTALGSVLGWDATEEILDAIFRDFCVGK